MTKNIFTVMGLAGNIAGMRSMIKAAVAEQEVWRKRLEALRGKGTIDKAHEKALKAGGEELIRRLEALVWPPTRENFESISKDGTWPPSEIEKALDAYPDPILRGELKYMFMGTLEHRDRIKAYTQYWELIGVHPRDAEPSEWCEPHNGWNLFVGWKTHEELAKREVGADDIRQKVHTGLAMAYKSIWITFVCRPKDAIPLSETREKLSEFLREHPDMMQEEETA